MFLYLKGRLLTLMKKLHINNLFELKINPKLNSLILKQYGYDMSINIDKSTIDQNIECNLLLLNDLLKETLIPNLSLHKDDFRAYVIFEKDNLSFYNLTLDSLKFYVENTFNYLILNLSFDQFSYIKNVSILNL